MSLQASSIVKPPFPFFVSSLLAAGMFLLPNAALQAQSPDAAGWKQHAELQRQLVQKIDEHGLTSAASDWIIPRDPQRLYVFTPQEKVHRPVESRLTPLLEEHAEKLFVLAKQRNAENQAAACFQLLHEVLFYNPNHEQVRKILGHRREGDGWHVSSDRLRLTVGTRGQVLMNWPAKSYLICKTPHFEIVSQADEAQTRLLAEKLELWHQVWRQVFFEYWSRSSTLQRWLDGKGQARVPTKKFQVVFFKDRDAYVKQLSQWIPGIAGSTGYYEASQKTSFFYAADDTEEGAQQEQATWRHELTHQLFHESRRSVEAPFQDRYLWLGEGIAMYFESLTESPRHVTLGGFDSRRMQYARLRCLKEQFYIPVATLTALDKKGLQTHPEIKKIYSQSAGLTHFLMSSNFGTLRPRLSEFLQLSYQGKLKDDSFNKILEITMSDIDTAYPDFLRVTSPQVESGIVSPETRTEFAFPRTPISATALLEIGKCPNLNWLDLSASDVRGKKLAGLRGCKTLRQLFLTGCLVDGQSLKHLEGVGQLTDLDLSASSVKDSDIASLKSLPSLANLNLSGTNISDGAIPALLKLPRLNGINLSGTPLTKLGLNRLQLANPNLVITF